MKRHMGLLMTVLLLLALAMPLAAQEEGPPRVGLRPDAPEYALHGPYWVGTMAITIEDAERPLPGMVWYPALNPDGLSEEITYQLGMEGLGPPAMNVTDGHALLDAPPDTSHGPYPLVVVSHTFAVPYIWMARLMEHLASTGFVVMAVDHVGNVARDFATITSSAQAVQFMDEAMDQFVVRVQDISRLIDAAERMTTANSVMAGMIDLEHVAALGVSYGGYTTLALAGGQLNLDQLPALCEGFDVLLPAQFQGTCLRYEDAAALDEWQAHIAALVNGDPEHGGYLQTLRDERVDAIVPIVPGPFLQGFGEHGLNGVDVPMLVLTALGDPFEDQPGRGNKLWDDVSSDRKIMVGFDDARFGIAFYCGSAWEQVLADTCTDPVWDRMQAHDLINHFTTAFLLDVLKGDTDAHAALAPDAASFPGITYEAEGF